MPGVICGELRRRAVPRGVGDRRHDAEEAVVADPRAGLVCARRTSCWIFVEEPAAQPRLEVNSLDHSLLRAELSQAGLKLLFSETIPPRKFSWKVSDHPRFSSEQLEDGRVFPARDERMIGVA